ncbi:glucuronate isomerase, partial [Proteiniclasticum ruminis]
WVEEGEVPEDYALLEQMVKEISYLNAEKYFNM